MIKSSFALLLALAIALCGCGGGKSSSTTNTVTVAINPTVTSLLPSQTQQFTATVSNSSNTNVNWEVDGVVGGAASTGTISTTGLYTAPSSISATVTHTVTAQSQADTTIVANASVVLTPPPPPYVPGIVVNPSSQTLPAGAQQSFTASVNGAPATVTWNVSCNSTVAGACGTIDANGVYTAPLAPPAGGTITVTATSTNGSANPGNASVTVQYSNQSLVGHYGFSFVGQSSTNAFAGAAGSIIFDGQGNVTGGEEDVTGTVGPIAITGGTYHLGTDGRGNVTVQAGSSSTTWQISLQNHARADAVTISATVVTAGSLDLQDATQFATSTTAAVSGNYAFQLAGASGANPANSLHRVGAFTTDGAGAISSGLMDQNDFGTATNPTIAGTYTAPDTNGRGVLTINGSAVAYYLVDANRLKLIDIDLATPAVGEAVKQPAGPFSAANVKGPFVVVMSGATSAGPYAKGAVFTLDGTSALTGKVDANNDGNVPAGYINGGALTGTYAVADATTGRTTMTWTEPNGSHSLVMYPGATASYVAELDSISISGTALAQQAIGYSNATLSGTFVTRARGFGFSPVTGPVAWAGTLSPSGGSAASGTLDLNINGTTTQSSALTGTYSMATNGRASFTTSSSSAALPNSSFAWYAVDANRVLYIEVDGNRVVTGIMQKRQ